MQQIELLQALFQQPEFAAKTAKIQGEKIFRVEIGGLRHYRRESGRLYKSLTTFLDSVMPANRFLQKWKEKMAVDLGAVDNVDAFVQTTADYGSGLHISVAEYCRNGGVDWGKFENWAFQYLDSVGFKNGTLQSAHAELIKDFASMLQFFYDYRVEVIAVEIPVWLDCGIATLIDLVVEMDEKNYTEKTPIENRKRAKSIINLKSGRKGFFETHVFQLEGERRMFNETYGNLTGEIKSVFNLAPNEWKDKPTYKLKDQTEEADAISEQFGLYIQIGKSRGVLSTPTKKFTIFTGKTGYGENPSDAMKTYNYDEFSLLKIQQKNENPAQN